VIGAPQDRGRSTREGDPAAAVLARNPAALARRKVSQGCAQMLPDHPLALRSDLLAS